MANGGEILPLFRQSNDREDFTGRSNDSSPKQNLPCAPPIFMIDCRLAIDRN
jgi:hypothetical protein